MTTRVDSLAPQALGAVDFPLHGSRLIEASAGTGKTWTIAALYLRLVLGHGGENAFGRPLAPADILVMTFTRAATRELSDRIRSRLLLAARCFRGEESPEPDDQVLIDLMADYPEGSQRNAAAWRLATAAEGMDDAAVHTIDAWCQRMLREHAFDSGSLFDEELVADEDAMRVEASQDYWRQQCYPLNAAQLERVLGVWSGVGELIKDMRALVGRDIPDTAANEPLGEVLARSQAEVAAAVRALKTGWDRKGQEMLAWVQVQRDTDPDGWNLKLLALKSWQGWIETLVAWSHDDDDLSPPGLSDTGWTRLTPDGLSVARIKPLPQGFEWPQAFKDFALFKEAFGRLPDFATPVRAHAAAWVARRLAQLKRQTGAFGFADMLHRLDTALDGDAGERLRKRIVTQYPVALIDEFQDTSPLQYRIFDKIYRTAVNDRDSALLLIGDPKQSIYGFRGADIYSYLAARRATEGRHYVLTTNYRSTRPLVDAVNHWFVQAEDKAPEAAFMFRKGDDNPLPFVPVHAKGRAERLVESAGDVPAMEIVHRAELVSARAIQRHFGELGAERIVSLLGDAGAGFAASGKPLRPIRPADIAVLVRTGAEARAVRRALRKRGVASVYLSDKDSVFASDEARDVLRWLRAVATPADMRLARAGLATSLIGFDLEALSQLAADDEAFDLQAEQLRQLLVVWQSQGVLAMLRKTLHRFGLPSKWLGQADGERRLTNMLHLAELLQTASTDLDGEQALIRWLAAQLQDTDGGIDEQIVRLESDADLVKVITIHKSKGLEYPYVLLPFVTCFRPVDRKTSRFLELAEDAGARRLLLNFSPKELEEAERDRLREDLRLLYVGLTRARHGLWIGFSAFKIGNKGSCQAYRSAAGYLLGQSAQVSADAWPERIAQFAAGQAEIRNRPAPDTALFTPLARQGVQESLYVTAPYRAAFDRNWSINSFSALVRDMPAFSSPLSPLQATRPADDEVPLPADVAASDDEADRGDAVAERDDAMRARAAHVSPRHTFVRGALAGNFLHAQLEWLAGERFALADNVQLADRLRMRCERAGYTRHAPEIVQWLKEVVSTPLRGVGASLSDLNRVIPEMEFWLPARKVGARALDKLCREYLLDGAPRPMLADRVVHGMLMGYADLVFEHDGRFWVLDYKSNHLGQADDDYTLARLTASMAEHRYDMQATIYLAALHRLLRSRLGPDYDPARHLGGAVYLYLRGIDGPEQGVYLVEPLLPLLEGVDRMLDPEGEQS